MNSTIQFYIFLYEEHKTDPIKRKLRKLLLNTLKNKFETFIPDNLDNCSICLESMQKISTIKTYCCHYFHMNCIKKWFKTNNETCPICRTDLKIKSIAKFSWNISKSEKLKDSKENTHINFNKFNDNYGNIFYNIELIVSGGMDSKGTIEYNV